MHQATRHEVGAAGPDIGRVRADGGLGNGRERHVALWASIADRGDRVGVDGTRSTADPCRAHPKQRRNNYQMLQVHRFASLLVAADARSAVIASTAVIPSADTADVA